MIPDPPKGIRPEFDRRLLLIAPAVALAAPLLAHAGFGRRGQIAFALVALASAIALAALEPRLVRRAVREPAVLILAALAALAGLSALWTIGDSAEALSWAAVIAGYAAVAVAGFVCARRAGVATVAGVVLAIAVVSAILGLVGAALHVEPLAERIGGAWRPGGPIEYAPALAALVLASLPLALRLMVDRGWQAVLGAFAVALGAATIALISSRAVLAIGIAILAVAVARPGLLGVRRPLVLAAAAVALSAACGADAVAGSYAEPYADGGEAWRLIGLATVLSCAVGLWSVLRACFLADGTVAKRRRAAALALAIVPLVATAGAAWATPDSGGAVEPDSGVTHGRTDIWAAAVSAASDEPLTGTGALTFLDATGAEQPAPPSRFAHNLVLEGWVELGAAGLLLTVALLGVAVVAVARSRGTPAAWLLGPGVLSFVALSLVDWTWHIPAATAPIMVLLGALAGAQARELGPARRRGRRSFSRRSAVLPFETSATRGPP